MSDQEKISFSERDKRRREQKNGQKQPRGKPAQKRSRWASEAYKRRVDERLFGKKADAGRSRMEERLRQSQGSPEFLRTYRGYLRDFGMPADVNLLLLLLDLDEEREVLKVIEELDSSWKKASPDEKNLLRKRLRNFELATSSDALADAAADLLSRI